MHCLFRIFSEKTIGVTWVLPSLAIGKNIRSGIKSQIQTNGGIIAVSPFVFFVEPKRRGESRAKSDQRNLSKEIIK